jgi:plasmid stabilization system protein ParE
MKIRWTAPAAEDLETIFNYLPKNHPGQARSTAKVRCAKTSHNAQTAQ